MKLEIGILVCLLVSVSAPASRADGTTDSLGVASRHPITLEEGRLSGPGADFLVEEAGKSRFFLVGEDHGVADILEFTRALFERIHPLGYDTYVTEVGPFSAGRLVEMARDESWRAAFEAFYGRYPFSIPFSCYREEADLLRAVATAEHAADPPILGIDQEFVLSPLWLLEDLRSLTHDEEIAAVVENLAREERGAFDMLVAEKDPQAATTLMSRPDDGELERLSDHFAGSGPERAIRLVEALTESREIYRAWYTGRYHQNNSIRAALMKRYFTEQYRPRPASRLLLKLGANHVMRGQTVMKVRDIGDLVARLADSNGERSFHLLVLALSGHRNAYAPFLPESARKVPIDPSGSPFGAAVELLGEAKAGAWQVVDLRALRSRDQLPRELGPLVQGFDAVLVLRDVRPATLIE